jgi:hypothetical protein
MLIEIKSLIPVILIILNIFNKKNYCDFKVQTKKREKQRMRISSTLISTPFNDCFHII